MTKEWTEQDWRNVRRALATLPYTGSIPWGTSSIDSPDTLVRWLNELRGQLVGAAARFDQVTRERDDARRIVAAGRTWFAAMSEPDR